jgi:hypothetical protein
MSLFYNDVIETMHRFTIDNSDGTSSTYMDFKLVAVILGSESYGPGANPEELPSADFKVHIIIGDEAATCADNNIAYSSWTMSDQTRDSYVEFQIPSILDDQELFTLESF